MAWKIVADGSEIIAEGWGPIAEAVETSAGEGVLIGDYMAAAVEVAPGGTFSSARRASFPR